MATSTNSTDSQSTTKRINPVTERTPLLLTSSQEGQVREIYYKRVRQRCADKVEEFATCAHDRTFSVTWMCRKELNAMNQCMMLHATQEEKDAARKEWFAGIEQRVRDKEIKAEKLKKDEKFWKDWWDRDLSKKPGEEATSIDQSKKS